MNFHNEHYVDVKLYSDFEFLMISHGGNLNNYLASALLKRESGLRCGSFELISRYVHHLGLHKIVCFDFYSIDTLLFFKFIDKLFLHIIVLIVIL